MVPTPTLVPTPSTALILAMELTPEIEIELIPAIEWKVGRVTHLWAVIQCGE